MLDTRKQLADEVQQALVVFALSLIGAPTATSTEAATAEKTAKNKGRKLIDKVPNQQGTPQGRTKFFCTACMKAFALESSSVPESLPRSHRKDDPELSADSGASPVRAEAEVVA